MVRAAPPAPLFAPTRPTPAGRRDATRPNHPADATRPTRPDRNGPGRAGSRVRHPRPRSGGHPATPWPPVPYATDAEPGDGRGNQEPTRGPDRAEPPGTAGVRHRGLLEAGRDTTRWLFTSHRHPPPRSPYGLRAGPAARARLRNGSRARATQPRRNRCRARASSAPAARASRSAESAHESARAVCRPR